MRIRSALGCLSTSLLIPLIYVCWPTPSQMWVLIHVRGPSESEQLDRLRVEVSDSSMEVLETFETELSASWSEDGWVFLGTKYWGKGMLEKILEESGEGLVVSIAAPHCMTKHLRVSRRDIRSNYDLPSLKLGGHGNGFHSAQINYEFSCDIVLECEFEAQPAAAADTPPAHR